ncbi:hypothetical protein [Labrys neptuniae]
MKGRLDISGYDSWTQLAMHLVVLLACLLASALICFGLVAVSAPFVLLQWIGFFTLAKFVYFVIAYVLFGGSFIDPLEQMYEDRRNRR